MSVFQLVCLDMSANKLFKLDMLKELASKTPDLNLLNLSNNKVRSSIFLFMSSHKIIRIFHGCEVQIEKSI